MLAEVGGAFAFFGLFLEAIGLFRPLSYSVGRRTKETGIRVDLGPRRSEIVALVLKDIGALMIGDSWVIATAIVLFLLTGLLAAGLPAYRAATVDPVRALREE